MVWIRKALSRTSDEGDGDLSRVLNPETLEEIERVISRVLSTIASSRKAHDTVTRCRFMTGSRMSELLIENPEEFREVLYLNYGQLTDEIIMRIVDALEDIAQLRERPPPLDSPKFKEFIVRLTERVRRRLDDSISKASIKYSKES